MRMITTEDQLDAANAHLSKVEVDPTLWVDQMNEPGFTIRVAVCEVPGGWATIEVWDQAEETTVDLHDTEEEAIAAAHEMIRVGREQALEYVEPPDD